MDVDVWITSNIDSLERFNLLVECLKSIVKQTVKPSNIYLSYYSNISINIEKKILSLFKNYNFYMTRVHVKIIKFLHLKYILEKYQLVSLHRYIMLCNDTDLNHPKRIESLIKSIQRFDSKALGNNIYYSGLTYFIDQQDENLWDKYNIIENTIDYGSLFVPISIIINFLNNNRRIINENEDDLMDLRFRLYLEKYDIIKIDGIHYAMRI